MIRKLEGSHDNVIGYSVGGEVSEEEYRQTASQLRDAIALHGTIRVLFRLAELSPQSFITGLDERFDFATEHADDIDRMAIVSDDAVTEWLTKLGGTVAPAEVKHFDTAEEDKAWAWLA